MWSKYCIEPLGRYIQSIETWGARHLPDTYGSPGLHILTYQIYSNSDWCFFLAIFDCLNSDQLMKFMHLHQMDDSVLSHVPRAPDPQIPSSYSIFVHIKRHQLALTLS